MSKDKVILICYLAIATVIVHATLIFITYIMSILKIPKENKELELRNYYEFVIEDLKNQQFEDNENKDLNAKINDFELDAVINILHARKPKTQEELEEDARA